MCAAVTAASACAAVGWSGSAEVVGASFAATAPAMSRPNRRRWRFIMQSRWVAAGAGSSHFHVTGRVRHAVGVIRRAHQRPGGDVLEAERAPVVGERLELG